MKKILFRGKRVDNGEWVEGYIVQIPAAIKYGGKYSSWYIDKPPKDPDDSHGVYNVAPETIGEFTGLTDKNGKRIFEGDIIYMGLFPYVIKYDNENARYMLFTSNGSYRNGFNIYTMETHEIIGNIYDNPELLERRP